MKLQRAVGVDGLHDQSGALPAGLNSSCSASDGVQSLGRTGQRSLIMRKHEAR